jgi:hypothetical protein
VQEGDAPDDSWPDEPVLVAPSETASAIDDAYAGHHAAPHTDSVPVYAVTSHEGGYKHIDAPTDEVPRALIEAYAQGAHFDVATDEVPAVVAAAVEIAYLNAEQVDMSTAEAPDEAIAAAQLQPISVDLSTSEAPAEAVAAAQTAEAAGSSEHAHVIDPETDFSDVMPTDPVPSYARPAADVVAVVVHTAGTTVTVVDTEFADAASAQEAVREAEGFDIEFNLTDPRTRAVPAAGDDVADDLPPRAHAVADAAAAADARAALDANIAFLESLLGRVVENRSAPR